MMADYGTLAAQITGSCDNLTQEMKTANSHSETLNDLFSDSIQVQKDLIDALNKFNKGSSGGTGGGGGGFSSGGSAADFSGLLAGGGKGTSKSQKAAKKAGAKHGKIMGQAMGSQISKFGIIASIGNAFKSLGKESNILSNLFGGIGKQSIQFNRDMREVAFVTEGVTGNLKDTQAEFAKIGATSQITGRFATEFQQKYVENLKAGNIGHKEMLDVTTSQLHISEMIGLKNGETLDVLRDWHVQMGLSNLQIAEIGRGIQFAARNTGLMGNALKEVIQQADQFVKMLRNADMLSARAASSYIEMLAQGKKFGVDESVQNILKAGTGLNNFLDASAETQTFMAMVQNNMQGGGGNFVEGFFGTKEDIKSFSEGMGKSFEDMTGKSIEEYNRLKYTMSAAEKQFMSMRIKAITGMELGEYLKTQEAIADAGRTYEDIQKEIDKALKSGLATQEEMAKLQQDKLNAGLQEGLGLMEQFNELSKPGSALTEMSDVLAHMNASPGEFSEKLRTAATSLKEMGGEDFSAQLETAIQNEDTAAMRALTEKMSKAQQEIAMEAKKGADPLSDIEQTVMEINDTLKRVLDPIAYGMAGVMAIATGGLSIAGSALVQGAQLKTGFDMVKGVLGFGGKNAAAKGAAGVGTRAATGAAAKGAAGVGTRAATGAAAKGVAGIGMKGLGAAAGATGIGLAVTAGLGAVWNSFEAGAKSAEIFGVKLEEVTMQQQMAAEAAGYYTGMFDALTFGLFSKWIGPTGTLTKKLAELYEIFWPFAALIQVQLLPWKVLWGTLKGFYTFFKEVFLGVWEGAKMAMEPITEIFNELKSVFVSAFEAIAPITESLGMGGKFSIVDNIVWPFKMLGKGIGLLGKGIGWLLKMYLQPLVWFVKKFAEAAKKLHEKLKPVIDRIVGAIEAFKEIGADMKKQFSEFGPWLYKQTTGAIIDNLPNWLKNLVKGDEKDEKSKKLADEAGKKAAEAGKKTIEKTDVEAINRSVNSSINARKITPVYKMPSSFASSKYASSFDKMRPDSIPISTRGDGGDLAKVKSAGSKSTPAGRLEGLGQKQADHLANIDVNIAKLLSLMGEKSGTPPKKGDTSSKTVPPRSTDYAAWQYGRYQQLASIGAEIGQPS
jgi:hypothetical protein